MIVGVIVDVITDGTADPPLDVSVDVTVGETVGVMGKGGKVPPLLSLVTVGGAVEVIATSTVSGNTPSKRMPLGFATCGWIT